MSFGRGRAAIAPDIPPGKAVVCRGKKGARFGNAGGVPFGKAAAGAQGAPAENRRLASGAILLALFTLLILTGISHADYSDFAAKFENIFTTKLNNWQPYAIVAISICFFFNLLLYMAGNMLESKELKTYATSEFMQVTASAMMIGLSAQLLFSLSGGNGMDLLGDIIGAGSSVSCGAPEISGGTFYLWKDNPPYGSGPLAAFRCKLQEKISALDGASIAVYKDNVARERWSSTCIIIFGVPAYCGDWDMAVHKDMEQAHLLSTKITALLVPLHSLYSLAAYIENNMLAVFLPAGLVLRILPLTRGVGGLFIAIAFGLFFVWPTFFVLTDPSFVKAESAENPNAARSEAACFTGFKGTSVLLQSVISSTSGGGSGGSLASPLDNAKELIYQLTISVMFYPFVAFAITLVFIRGMTPLFGGDMGDFMKMVGRLG